MKLFAAIGLMLDKVVKVVDASSDAIVTLAEATQVLADSGKDLSLMAKATTEQMLAEQSLEMQREMLLLERDLEDTKAETAQLVAL